MKNLIDVLKQKEREAENVQHEMEKMQRVLENIHREIDVLRSAVQMCAENEAEAAAALMATPS